jgi:predicted regulator of Ras-like GTPase activity (Roadblock/LC7/MglB family)
MENLDQIDQIMMEIDNNPDVTMSLVILKSGLLVAGCVPEEIQLETFVAMASILISAAESATSEIQGKLDKVFVELDRATIIIESAGRKGALVVLTNKKNDNGNLNTQINKAALSLKEVL